MAVAYLGSITVDCDDPAVLANFWAELLGGVIAASSEKFVGVKLPHVILTAIRIPNYQPPFWPDQNPPKQIHLDLSVADLDAAQAEAVRLGARLCDYQPAPDKRRVLLDPAGHPFCLCLPRSP
ncbi:VOC family protein [Nocardia sp. NPDC046763]|uniref:VOC family protein n=1 Tax=Nocardia sp. NPDC046763 TaxID=3155256 RepID=UPI0033D4BE32